MWKPSKMGAILLAAIVMPTNVVPAEQPPDVKALIEQLKDKDEVVRLKAAKMLGKLKAGAKDAIPDLKAACSDPDEDVRSVAKQALGLINEAMQAVQREKDLAALEVYLKKLRAARTPADKIAVLQQLGELGERAKEAGTVIVSLGIMDANPKVREVASAAYEKIDPPVHKEIIIVLFDKEAATKYQSILALTDLGPKARAAAPALKYIYAEDRKELVTKGLWEPALTALVKLTPDDAAVHDALLTIIANPRESQNSQELALKLMKPLKIDAKKKVTALIAGITYGQNYRAYMVTELGGMRKEAKVALPLLTKLKLDPDADVRKAAAEAFDNIKE